MTASNIEYLERMERNRARILGKAQKSKLQSVQIQKMETKSYFYASARTKKQMQDINKTQKLDRWI